MYLCSLVLLSTWFTYFYLRTYVYLCSAIFTSFAVIHLTMCSKLQNRLLCGFMKCYTYFIRSSNSTPVRATSQSVSPQSSTGSLSSEHFPKGRPNTKDFITFLCLRGTYVCCPADSNPETTYVSHKNLAKYLGLTLHLQIDSLPSTLLVWICMCMYVCMYFVI